MDAVLDTLIIGFPYFISHFGLTLIMLGGVSIFMIKSLRIMSSNWCEKAINRRQFRWQRQFWASRYRLRNV